MTLIAPSGHVLFEMCAGYELSAAHPTPKHLDDIAGYPQVQLCAITAILSFCWWAGVGVCVLIVCCVGACLSFKRQGSRCYWIGLGVFDDMSIQFLIKH